MCELLIPFISGEDGPGMMLTIKESGIRNKSDVKTINGGNRPRFFLSISHFRHDCGLTVPILRFSHGLLNLRIVKLNNLFSRHLTSLIRAFRIEELSITVSYLNTSTDPGKHFISIKVPLSVNCNGEQIQIG